MLKDAFSKIEKDFAGTLEYDIPRAKYAYYRIGGLASVIATPRSFADLQKLHSVLSQTNSPYFILGWGSNLLFSDADYAGVVIRMKHLFTEIEMLTELDGKKGNFLKLGASLGAASLLKKASEAGYGGLACLTGIPGSVGGMVAMNAGTHLGEIGKRLVKTEFVNLNETPAHTGDLASSRANSPANENLPIQTRTHEASDFSYRENHFLKPGDLITHAYLHFDLADPEAVKTEINDLYQRRKSTQPVNLPSCGSVFKNPREHGMHAWQVIEKLGLRGHQIGQAQISEKHPNFIVNLGDAKASDVKALIDLVKSRANTELGISLKEEVKTIP